MEDLKFDAVGTGQPLSVWGHDRKGFQGEEIGNVCWLV